MEPLSFDGYTHLVTLAQTRYPEWRLGQTYFNVLYQVRPDLSEQVRATKLDPFHQNRPSVAFLRFVQENW